MSPPATLPRPVTPLPEFETERLLLRAFRMGDAPDVQRLAGERDVASTTINIPHPYADGMAETWILTQHSQCEAGVMAAFAIILRADATLVGAVGLALSREHRSGELGYWVGKPYWANGYCTEAARAVLRFGFETLDLHRIHAAHFARNPASGRVMQKLGMRWEGCLREHVLKWGAFEDLVKYALLRSEWEAPAQGT